MPDDSKSVIENTLLAALTKPDSELLKSKLEWTDLNIGDLLYEAHKSVDYAYFPTSGICSVIAQNAEGVKIETGLIGREGFVGIPIVLFAESAPSQVIVQASGRALRISRGKLLKAIQESPSLLKVLLRFAHTFSVQIAQTALANGRNKIYERLARWLLMCQDRVDSHEFPMTHKFLANMLAVRRAGITDALSFLEGKKCIRAMRGHILITDRKGLEEMAGATYGVPEREYQRLLT
ncbi:MAG TPA: Crp/Fnr family transcriptional regulator [Aestuariivirga sp.]|nr:Crp/Fnr family transcriptional regulator [Aestuariivirga sp.]